MFDPDYIGDISEPTPAPPMHPRGRIWRPQPKEQRQEAPRGGSRARYAARLKQFLDDKLPLPKTRHHALWLLHNCVAHPLLALGPTTYAMDFHELTSLWLNKKPNASRGSTEWARWLHYRVPEIKHRRYWVLHNVVAHTLIGIAPFELTFKFHDWSAVKMDVQGWV